MPLAASAPRSRLTATKSRQPVASSSSSSSSTSSAHPTTTSIRSKSGIAPQSAPPPQPSPLLLNLPPSLPTLTQLESCHDIRPAPHLIARRLISLARTFLALHSEDALSPDPLDWELDLCSATFFSIYAVCLDPSSTLARSTLARCARLGGFNIVLPFSPSASAASATVSASKLSSHDPHDIAGAHACIHVLQQGNAATFQDAASAKEYRDACRTLGRSTDAVQVTGVLRDKVLGKRKAIDSEDQDFSLPEPVSSQSRYHSQLQTDEAYNAASRGRTQEAQSSFIKALELDPFNWRAWAGLCDTGYGSASASKHLGPSTLDHLYASLAAEVQAPYIAMEASLKSSPPFCNEQNQSSTMIRKVSEDGSNKKIKVSSEVPPMPSLPQNAPRNGGAARPMDKVTPPLPTTSASTVTATRLHPASRALSAALTNTHHLEPVSADQDDVKAAKMASVRTATVAPTTAANARQLRSTRGNATAPTAAATNGSRTAAVPSRSGATSQAGSVSSTSSGSSASSMSSRAAVSTARTAVSNRRVASAAPTQASLRVATTKPTSTSAARTAAANGTGVASKRTTVPASTRLTAAGSVSRPGSAMSKASSTSTSGATTTARANSTLASSRTAAEAMRLKEEEVAKAKLNQLNSMREPIVNQLALLAQQQAVDRYVLALFAQVGEAYRLLRLCEGGAAASVLLGPVLDVNAVIADAKSEASDNAAPSTSETWSLENMHTIDRLVQDSLLHHLLLARSYAECSSYASSEHHFAAVRKSNPYIAAHMDIYSLVLFHLSREVKLSALAQHLSLIAPSTASTHIVVGNAFSLQKEHQTALVCFQRAAIATPEYAYAYTLAGHEAHDLGLHDEAIAYFRSAVRCDRRHWNAWAGLGRVYLGLGEGNEYAACKSLQLAIGVNPGNYVLWDLVGWTFALLGAAEKAIECYDRAVQLAPSASVLTYLRRAELLLQHGKVEESHADLVRANELAPEEASIHVLLAQSYMRLGGVSFVTSKEEGAGKPTLRASGTMVLPERYQAEITHHLSVAVDLDPSLLRLVKSICEGYKTLPGSKLNVGGGDMSYSQSHMSYSRQDASASGLANSTPYGVGAGMVLPPADFATSHPAHPGHDSSFLSVNTGASSADIVLEDADVSV